MKKGHLFTGIGYVLAGCALLAVSLGSEGRLGSLLFGFAFAALTSGIVMIGKYCYWTRPENRERYRERLEQERVELHDELNEKLSDRSARYAYLLGLGTRRPPLWSSACWTCWR